MRPGSYYRKQTTPRITMACSMRYCENQRFDTIAQIFLAALARS
jgi:hypothetical protein